MISSDISRGSCDDCEVLAEHLSTMLLQWTHRLRVSSTSDALGGAPLTSVVRQKNERSARKESTPLERSTCDGHLFHHRTWRHCDNRCRATSQRMDISRLVERCGWYRMAVGFLVRPVILARSSRFKRDERLRRGISFHALRCSFVSVVRVYIVARLSRIRLMKKEPNNRVETNRHPALCFWSCEMDAEGYGACVSPSPASGAHPKC